MKPIKKAVIPAAGFGTRFLPITKSMPKEMLPIIDRPVIQFVVEEALSAGIEDILFITGRGKRSIEDYFDSSPELQAYLKNHGKNRELKILEDIENLCNIYYIRQKEANGLGDAILQAEHHVGNEAFAVLLGDDIIHAKKPCIGQLIDQYNQYGKSILSVEKIFDESISQYGVIEGIPLSDCFFKVKRIVEKPDVISAPSNLGTVGRYVLTPDIFTSLKKIKPGYGGEIQLTDAIQDLILAQDVYAVLFEGKRFDTGNKKGYLETVIHFALQEPELREYVFGLLLHRG